MNGRNFLALIESKKVKYRINDAGLATVLGVSEKTFKRRKKHPEEFSLGEIMILFRFLKFTNEEKVESII